MRQMLSVVAGVQRDHINGITRVSHKYMGHSFSYYNKPIKDEGVVYLRTAIVDIGTNSTRLLIAEQLPEGFNTVQTGLITTRLGEGIGQQSFLLEPAMERTLAALLNFRQIIAEAGAARIIVAATSAVRDAANRDEFLVKVRSRLGWEVKVLSGKEEAYASYLGVVQGLGDTVSNPVVIDIGGGSTEFIWQTVKELNCISLRLGAVRMTENKMSPDEIKKMVIPLADRINGTDLVGVGGTLTTLAAIDQQMDVYDPARVHGYFLSRQHIAGILNNLESVTLEKRKQILGLQPERADIVNAGVRIALTIIEVLGCSGVTVSETDILYGLLHQAN